eukprot:755889-Hanusia_phi.AAC.7
MGQTAKVEFNTVPLVCTTRRELGDDGLREEEEGHVQKERREVLGVEGDRDRDELTLGDARSRACSAGGREEGSCCSQVDGALVAPKFAEEAPGCEVASCQRDLGPPQHRARGGNGLAGEGGDGVVVEESSERLLREVCVCSVERDLDTDAGDDVGRGDAHDGRGRDELDGVDDPSGDSGALDLPELAADVGVGVADEAYPDNGHSRSSLSWAQAGPDAVNLRCGVEDVHSWAVALIQGAVLALDGVAIVQRHVKLRKVSLCRRRRAEADELRTACHCVCIRQRRHPGAASLGGIAEAAHAVSARVYLFCSAPCEHAASLGCEIGSEARAKHSHPRASAGLAGGRKQRIDSDVAVVGEGQAGANGTQHSVTGGAIVPSGAVKARIVEAGHTDRNGCPALEGSYGRRDAQDPGVWEVVEPLHVVLSVVDAVEGDVKGDRDAAARTGEHRVQAPLVGRGDAEDAGVLSLKGADCYHGIKLAENWKVLEASWKDRGVAVRKADALDCDGSSSYEGAQAQAQGRDLDIDVGESREAAGLGERGSAGSGAIVDDTRIQADLNVHDIGVVGVHRGSRRDCARES